MNKRDRWTIVDVDEDLIEFVKKLAKANGFTTAGALKYMQRIVENAQAQESAKKSSS